MKLHTRLLLLCMLVILLAEIVHLENILVRTGKSSFRLRPRQLVQNDNDKVVFSGSIEARGRRRINDPTGREIGGCGRGKCLFADWLYGSGSGSGYEYDYGPHYTTPMEYCEDIYDTFTDEFHELCYPV